MMERVYMAYGTTEYPIYTFLYRYKFLWIGWVMRTKTELDIPKPYYDTDIADCYSFTNRIVCFRIGFRKKAMVNYLIRKAREESKKIDEYNGGGWDD